MSGLNIAVVCSANMNRSMEAHAYLAKKGFRVKSFGTAEKVWLPGTAPDRPNCYDFRISYDYIYKDLQLKDETFYTRNGLLNMLNRNRRVKLHPERFQDSKEVFDIIITCEERVYNHVLHWFESRKSVSNKPVHVVNVDIPDNHEDATLGSFLISDIVTMMSRSSNLDNDIDELVHTFVVKTKRPIINSVVFY